MKSIQDLNLFKDDEDFNVVKKNSIDELIKDRNIVNTLNEFNLTRKDIENNWIDFLDYKEDLDECIGCNSLKSCPKVSKGMKRTFTYSDNVISLALAPCAYGQEHFENQEILNNILLKNVNSKLLLTKSSDLIKLLNQKNNAKNIIDVFRKFTKSPSSKGVYLYGNPGVGKSTLMGWLVRTLVLEGHQCGYIHFPTFLMELKSSFGEEGIDSSIELMRSIDYLIIDDIGGESVTAWSRDEVLSSVLAYRGQNGKATFFTSVYPLKELKKYYMLKTGDTSRVERLIDRIIAVSNDYELTGNDLR